jgi:aminotransferase EvaB
MNVDTQALQAGSATKPNLSQESAIPAFDYLKGFQSLRSEFLEAIERVLDSGSLILGQEVTALEHGFAQYIGSKYAIGVSSGTDAIIVALRALDIGPGHEVITVANGPVPTIAAIRAVGATPRFVDVDEHSLQIDPGLVSQAITHATRCVLPIHLYGSPAPVLQLAEICRDNQLALIEDCAQAHGTNVANRHAGTVGQVGCFSFYPTKNLGAFGDGGMCVTEDPILAGRIREQRCYGFRNDRVAHVEGLNCRLDELQAACLSVRLKYLPTTLAKRRQIALYYHTDLACSKINLPQIPCRGKHSWHQYVVRVAMRDAWIRWLAEQNVNVGVHYSQPVHLMPAYFQFGGGQGTLPVTEQACREVMSLPIFPELEAEEMARVCQALRSGVEAGLT